MSVVARRLLPAAALCFVSGPALAQALQWQVSESAGSVTIRHAGVDRPGARGAVLAPGDTVSTGANGRAVLVHERDFVTLAPRSRTAVPEAAQATGFTKLLQDLGNAVYKIEKRGVPHFGVTTPYLAAVVKGTTFSVTVDGGGTSLQVVEGAVEVATPDGGARDLIRPGMVATIAARDTMRLTVHGSEDRVVDSPAHAPAAAAPAAPAAETTPTAAATAGEPVANANSGTTTTSVAGTAATSVPAATPAVEPIAVNALASAQPLVIPTAITSKPVELGQLSGGLVSGVANVVAATVATTAAVKLADASHIAATHEPTPVAASPSPVIAAAATLPVSSVVATSTTPVNGASTSSATTPVVTTPVVTTPVATTPVATTPAVTTSVVTTPVVTTPVGTTPAVTTPVVTTPVGTTPAVTTPSTGLIGTVVGIVNGGIGKVGSLLDGDDELVGGSGKGKGNANGKGNGLALGLSK